MNSTASCKLAIVIPCMNEAGRVGPVIKSVFNVFPQARVVVVDDASTDATAAEARAAGAMVLPHSCNLGYGAALETGYLYALREGFDCVLQMDGDGQHCAEELPRILKPLQEGTADLVLGSRYQGQDPAGATSPLRRLGHWSFSQILRIFTRKRFTDPTSGFQALNRRTLTLFASGVFPCDYPDSDVILMTHLAGLQITEVPVRMKPRKGGVSMHAGLKPLYYGMKMLLAVFIVLLNLDRWRCWARVEGQINK